MAIKKDTKKDIEKTLNIFYFTPILFSLHVHSTCQKSAAFVCEGQCHRHCLRRYNWWCGSIQWVFIAIRCGMRSHAIAGKFRQLPLLHGIMLFFFFIKFMYKYFHFFDTCYTSSLYNVVATPVVGDYTWCLGFFLNSFFNLQRMSFIILKNLSELFIFSIM